MRLVIVSGLSGAGKGVALHALEDIGYHCVDNLPLSLLPDLAAALEPASEHGSPRQVAVVIDARNLTTRFEHFSKVIDDARGRGLEPEVVYVGAQEEVLLKRFNETRRTLKPLVDNPSASLFKLGDGVGLVDIKAEDLVLTTNYRSFDAGGTWLTAHNVSRGQSESALDRDYSPIEDMRASVEYRSAVTRNLLEKFFLETSNWDGETRVLEHGSPEHAK